MSDTDPARSAPSPSASGPVDDSAASVQQTAAASNRPGRGLRWVLWVGGLGVMGLVVLFGAAVAWQFLVGSSLEGGERATDPVITTPAAGKEGEGESEPLPGILAGISKAALAEAEHPLDPFLDVARAAREKLLEEVADYSAVMSNEVRLTNGRLREPQYMEIKIRHARGDGPERIPFSIYSRFIKPASVAGQEAIWVEGRNDGNLIAHPAGVLNWQRFSLDPNGSIAMNGNRHPIYEMGMERLLNQMIEKGERDRKQGLCDVSFRRDVEVNGRRCLQIEITHPKREAPFDFHRAVIYVDIERAWPIGYEAFDWPADNSSEPPLIERYFYSDIQPNLGLQDIDFDPDNESYQYPG